MMCPAVPVTIDDPINVAILTISEDRLAGFQRDPIAAIVRQSGVDAGTVIERFRAMLVAGTLHQSRTGCAGGLVGTARPAG